MNKKYISLIGLGAIAISMIGAVSLTSNSLFKIHQGLATEQSVTFSKDTHLTSDDYLVDADNLVIAYSLPLLNGKFVSVEGEGLGTSYETYNFSNSNAYISSDSLGNASQCVLTFNIKGITKVSWSCSMTNLSEYYNPSFNVIVYDKVNEVSLGESSTMSDNSLTISNSGTSSYCRLSFSSYSMMCTQFPGQVIK